MNGLSNTVPGRVARYIANMNIIAVPELILFKQQHGYHGSMPIEQWFDCLRPISSKSIHANNLIMALDHALKSNPSLTLGTII